MRIGLFSDTYTPQTNGIVFVVQSAKTQLEALGHEVFLFCPDGGKAESDADDLWKTDGHIIRLRNVHVPGSGKDGPPTSVFNPVKMLDKVRELQLDVIHFYSPSAIGLFGCFCARKLGIPLVGQHCTDIVNYSRKYPVMKLSAIVGTMMVPVISGETLENLKALLLEIRPRLSNIGSEDGWDQRALSRIMGIIYGMCDRVVALSEKNKQQVLDCGVDERKVIVMPTGVDPLPEPKPSDVEEFRARFGIQKTDRVVGYVGRLAREKNLNLLLKSFYVLAGQHEDVKLLMVGDNEYREVLEMHSKQSPFHERIIFTGRIPREELSVAYSALDVFAFTSLTDTQGLVLHEAAGAKLPIVVCEPAVTEVVEDGKSGYFARPEPEDVAEKVALILADNKRKIRMGERSRELALQFTEQIQTAKQLEMYHDIARVD